MTIRQSIRKFLRKNGFDIIRYDYMNHQEARRINLISHYGITVILDVGANNGQYAAHLRDMGFQSRIVSFEPLSGEYATLKARAHGDHQWETKNYALGDTDSQQEINISENSHSSSMLSVLPRHIESAPGAKSIGKQTIIVKKLDTIYSEVCTASDVTYLKLDAQGYEMKILNGGTESLKKIDTIQLEMSLTPLYDGETGLPEMTNWLYDQGYVLVSLEPGHADSRTGQLMQVDGIFHRFDD